MLPALVDKFKERTLLIIIRNEHKIEIHSFSLLLNYLDILFVNS